MNSRGRAVIWQGLSFCACALACLQWPLQAFAVCRIVEPLGESGGVVFDPTTLVLYVLAPGQPLGSECIPDRVPPAMSTDASAPPVMFDDMDAGPDDDDDGGAPVMSMPDAGMSRLPMLDAGFRWGSAGAGAIDCPNGTHSVPKAGSVVHMVVQPSVLSTGRAGLVMPVPARPDVHMTDPDLFTEIGLRLEPRIETRRMLIEDESLGYQCNDPKFGRGSGGGCGGDVDDEQEFHPGPGGTSISDLYDPETENDDVQRAMFDDGVVSFATALSTDDYDVTVVNASSPGALMEWLDQNQFAHDADDDRAFSAYVAEGSWFVALDVHPQGFRDLDPLVVSWPGETIPIMHRLQYDPDGGELITDMFVMARTRMDAADQRAETLYAAPAGFGGELKGFGLASGWITQLRLTRETSQAIPDSELIAAYDFEERPVLVREEKVRIPSSKCPRSNRGDGCACRLDPRSGGGLAASLGPSMVALLFIAFRSRRRGRGQLPVRPPV